MDEDNYEPVGSCEECGVNLYKDDHPELCDGCLWGICEANGCEPDEVEV